MLESVWSESPLLSNFADFYSDLSECKLAIREGRQQQLLQSELPANPTLRDVASALHQRLLRCLQRQQFEVERGIVPIERHVYRRAQYVMAALGDETFLLELEWPGAEHWLSVTLEEALFGSQQAGRLFFSQIDDLPRLAGARSVLRDLVAVHLLALQLGFRGECRGKSEESRLVSYREQLIRLLGESRSEILDLQAMQPFLQARSYTLPQRGDERLAPLRPWYRFCAWGVALYLLLTSVLWLGYLGPAVYGLKASLQ